MPIPITCGKCGKSLKVADHLAGRTGRCPACGEEIVVPSPGEKAPETRSATDSHAASHAPARVRRSAMRRARAIASSGAVSPPPAAPASPPEARFEEPPPAPDHHHQHEHAHGHGRLRRGLATHREFSTGLLAVIAATRSWVLFLAVLGFLYVGIALLLTGVAIVVVVGGGQGGRPEALLTIIALFAQTVIYLLPTWFLWRYARGIREFNAAPDDHHLVAALHAQQSFFRVVGVYALLGLIFAAIGVGVVLSGGLALMPD